MTTTAWVVSFILNTLFWLWIARWGGAERLEGTFAWGRPYTPRRPLTRSAAEIASSVFTGSYRAMAAYWLLQSWCGPPGVKDTKDLAYEPLHAWVDAARAGLQTNGRRVIGDLRIGEAVGFPVMSKRTYRELITLRDGRHRGGGEVTRAHRGASRDRPKGQRRSGGRGPGKGSPSGRGETAVEGGATLARGGGATGWPDGGGDPLAAEPAAAGVRARCGAKRGHASVRVGIGVVGALGERRCG